MGFKVSGIERIAGNRLRTDELRYFQNESGEAEQIPRIMSALSRAHVKGVQPKFIPLTSSTTRIRPNHFELWFKADSLTEESSSPLQ